MELCDKLVGVFNITLLQQTKAFSIKVISMLSNNIDQELVLRT